MLSKNTLLNILFIALFLPCILLAENKKAETAKKNSLISEITSIEEFQKVLDNSGKTLLLFDLYADWCMPCKILSPLLEDLAFANKDKAKFYKINVDKQQEIAAAFKVTGIPLVVFVKEKNGIRAFTGVQSKTTYQQVINQYSESGSEELADGTLEAGIRIIKRKAGTAPGDIYVYRGDKVRLVIEDINSPLSIHIPKYKVSQAGVIGKNIQVEFKAKEIGTFPVYCNGKCPSGDGSQIGRIVVMQLKSSDKAKFTELNAKQTANLLKNQKPLILDVRTPNEFYSGHIKDAILIPLHQLEDRVSEIASYKEKDVLVYCRSGNRSTVASKILIDKGFKKLYNLRPGIKGWQKAGYDIVK